MSFEKLAEKALGGHTDFDKLEAYYEKEQRLEALGVNLPDDVRLLELVSSFPKLAVDVLVEVLNVEGFTLKDDPSGVCDLLWKWWQANDLDTQMHLAMTEALVQGQSFLIVGEGTDDIPRVTVHQKKGVGIERGLFGEVIEAVVIYGEPNNLRAAHYLPGVRQDYVKGEGNADIWTKVGDPAYLKTQRVPVIPMTNKARIKDVKGRSEMLEVLDLADGESRSMTGLQVAQESVALPQRYLFANGLHQFKDQAGNVIKKFQAYISSIWTGPEGAQAGQFPGADLQQIINVIKLYSQKVSALTGIPPSMLGISTDNPASAEAMRVAKDRLITKGEFKQHLFGDSIEEMAMVMLDMYGKLPAEAETLETNWRDVATPSKSAKSANIIAAATAGLVSAHTARNHLELTPEERAYEDEHEEQFSALAAAVGLTGQQKTQRPAAPAAPAEARQ